MRLLQFLRRIGFVVIGLLSFIAIPFIVFWRLVGRPIFILLYKAVLVIRKRLDRFFFAQHKTLAIVSHRYAVHSTVFVIGLIIVGTNLLNAQEVRAESFDEGSLISQIVGVQDEIITSDRITPVPVSYIDQSAVLKPSLGIGQDDNAAVVTNSLNANTGTLTKPTLLGDSATGTNNQISTYTVQGGDTVSSIAAEFDISVKTIEWANNLSENSVIKPGDTLFILPTSGVPYTVQSGDTLNGIAAEFDADTEDIIEFNDLFDAEDLIAGTEIIIPGGSKPAPVAPATSTSTPSFGSVGSGAFAVNTSLPSAAVSSTKLQWPTTTQRISQYYHYGHNALDIDGEFGDPVYAPESGTVISAGYNGCYGIEVVIDHGGGLVTRSAHMQKIFVSAGQTVSRGQTVGEEGSTGCSSGSHIHYEVIVSGRKVNPFNYY